MAVLGKGGIITLSREWPDPLVVYSDTITVSNVYKLDIEELGFWAGDYVFVACDRGVPFDLLGTGYANCPGGHALYGGGGILGPACAHRGGDGDEFYASSDAAAFYESPATTGLVQSFNAFIHRDEMDRATFYATELGGVNGGEASRLELYPIDFGSMVLGVGSAVDGYQAAMRALSADIPSEGTGEAALSSVAELPEIAKTAGDCADARGWKRLCGLENWVFDVNSSNLDTTAIGADFGDAIKGLVRGAGSFNGEVSNEYVEGETGASLMLRLLMLLRRGSGAMARFQIADGANLHSSSAGTILDNKLFYETRIILGRTSVNVASGDIVKINAEFISTGGIRLVSGEPDPPEFQALPGLGAYNVWPPSIVAAA